jgi:hypothetical protein
MMVFQNMTTQEMELFAQFFTRMIILLLKFTISFQKILSSVQQKVGSI